MSMVTSCTLLSRAAPPAKLPRGALQSGRPAAVALQRKPRPLSVRCAAEKAGDAFDIVPFALVHPNFPPRSGNRWRIKEEEDYVKLWFHVGDKASKENLEVRVEDDVLLVRSKSAVEVGGPANWLDVRLLVPNGYDKGKMEAELTFGSLLVTIGKHKPPLDKIKTIPISPKDTNSTPKP